MKTVDWDFKQIDVECDNCYGCHRDPFIYEFDEYPDFKDCQQEIQSYGWESHKIGGDWYDFCCHECYLKYLQGSLEEF